MSSERSFEKNPLALRGQPLLTSENPGWQAHPYYKVWLPKIWVSVLQNAADRNEHGRGDLVATLLLYQLLYRNAMNICLKNYWPL